MPKILVVDDDSTLRRFLSDYLSTQAFNVVAAANGPEALRVVYREQPDLVLVDVMMPGMDGWELTVRLRELGDMPIILLTAKSSENDKLRGFRLGVDDYVTKPFSFAELTARIQAVLARSRAAAPALVNVITFGGSRSSSTPAEADASGEVVAAAPEEAQAEFILDMNARELRRNGQTIPLTPTEFRLLEYLARAQGRAISEAELIQEVWGAYRQEETAAVRRYIWMLRQKIEPDPANPRFILTVRGYGYRLES
ncbi:MAG TPA: response regulator transcription factor [Anaerolineaceae bacterium]|nr:response regulator transcription factor [Anaerolineaceae bacterium]